MRTLCTIQTIKALEDIQGKDRIKLASFESVGWRVIVGIDMKPGDKVVYVEPDTILPVKPEFEFLRARCFNSDWNGFRIKRMKMGGVLSEGLAIPLAEVVSFNAVYWANWADNTDVTEKIGAIKYDPELREEMKNAHKQKKYPWILRVLFRIPLFKKLFMKFFIKKSGFGWPDFVSKTDETRVQNLSYLFNMENKHIGKLLNATEKLDGQSATFALHQGIFYICSRNLCVYKEKVGKLTKNKETDTMHSRFIQTAIDNDIEAVLMLYAKETGHGIYLQGEQIGPGIQGNKYGLKEIELHVFNIKDVTTGMYFNNQQVNEFCGRCGLKSVQSINDITLPGTMEELIELAKGRSILADIPREGIVLRTPDVMPAERGMANMFSFKVINPDFLVKYGLE
jgi:hypothetical protein